MIINCPNCKATFNVSAEKIPDGGGKLRCFKCKEVFLVKGGGPDNGDNEKHTVVIANESKAFCQTVSDLLDESGIHPEIAYDGEEALRKIRELRPAVVLLDVALPKVFGFEVCETVKSDKDLAPIKVILIAAIYDKTKYKRNPDSLYGADDYIEKHHIHDRLVDKIWALTDEKGALPAQSHVAPDPVVAAETEKEVSKSSSEENGEDHEKASRLARIIVSDIALYNEQLVNEGIKNNNFYDLLKDDIEEGRKLFIQRVPKEIREKKDYLKESLDEFIDSHGKTL
ncbi:MAG: zinc-ribbon domain-containing protein [Deltaproteobacteria bacterium]|nr:zinc-ribbon domain-containing protein [Deltaproteobacteria bacterium]